MPFQPTVSGNGQAPAGSMALVPATSAMGRVLGAERPAVSDAAARHVATPESLRRAIRLADAGERQAILLQMSWLTHVLAERALARDRCASIERLCIRADAARGELPFDKAALTQVWRVRFSHLLQGVRPSDFARDLMRWCSASRDPTSLVARWQELCGETDAPPDMATFIHLPLREWPVAILGVALSLSNLREAALSDLTLPHADLRGVSASHAQFRGGQFNDVAWCDARLRHANFAFSNHVNADFERADLRGVCFRAAGLTGARMVDVDLRGAEFLHTVMNGAEMSEANGSGVTFAKVRLDDAALHRARLCGARLTDSSARGLALIGARARHSRWTSVAMGNGRASGADLRDAEFRQCDLVGWDVRGAKLNGAYFEACDMRRARFCGASLKRLRIGRDCDLGGTQWQDARLSLDGAWLRQLTPVELEQTVQSWMTLPVDQPAVRANVFLQLLGALARRSCFGTSGMETAPSLHRLPASVQRSRWLGRVLVGPSELSELGVLSAPEGFATLRAQWVTRKLSMLTDVRLSCDEARWTVATLMTELHRRCASTSPDAVWPYAGAICQTLYWAGERVGCASDARTRALRVAWLEALPAHVHVALSADGVDPLDPSFFVLTRADGEVAVRLPKALLAGVLGSETSALPREGDAVFARDPVPGWRWAGVRVVVRDETSPDDFVPGTMRQLQGLLREFGFLAGIWPVERTLDALVRLTGRWLGDDARERASAACGGIWRPVGEVVAETVPDSQRPGLSMSDRIAMLIAASPMPAHIKLRAAAHADIEEVFRACPVFSPEADVPLSVSMSRRVRLVSVTAGLCWLATQPEWYLPASVSGGDEDGDGVPERQRLACRQYALAVLNETMTGDALWRRLPQALALRACLASESSSSRRLAQCLADWLTCADVRDLPGLAQACRHTLPWFWAVRFPLPADAIRKAVTTPLFVAAAKPGTRWNEGRFA
ncbi:pentapeptide repeat-containing protein [Pandoraea anhela]|uniref:Secreted effector protein PipB2 n=1 Tax=Pandoraea anhela TaxID=2508295 RepID=A0A5E4Z5N9_9BURK|nr:pentapeptide repeat-containing protein [Pandoraea anhela]VVE56551.1 Secreted effector protein PipB2 [Pandoraea anhela]